MKPRVYVETSIISYLTARKSRSVVVAGQQQATRRWWRNAHQRFELVTSQLVLDEAGAGDKAAAKRRLDSLEQIPLLDITEEAQSIARRLVHAKALPPKAAQDALHVAIAAVHAAQVLLTWNCRHLANALIRRAIEQTCADAGYNAPVICTPNELPSEE
jgi:predicted nucleic acid-binding protein